MKQAKRLRVIVWSFSPMHFLVPLLIVVLAVMSPAAAQAKRLAFVVGIDNYTNFDAGAQLKRAVNDARSIGQALRKLGFEVTPLHNAGRSAFNASWQQFLGAIEPNDEVVFFFAGHGAEIEEQNFLTPGDIPKFRYGQQELIERESLSVSELRRDLHSRKPRVSLIILDACRDHPLAPPEWRSSDKWVGLAEIDESHGTFIMYSAGPGERALDRLPGNDPDPVNSVYMRTLLPLLGKPGLTLPNIAKQVRREVEALVATVPHVQTPAYFNGILDDYCLAGCANQLSTPDLWSQGGVPAKPPRNRIVLTTSRPTDAPLRFMAEVLSKSSMGNSVISLKGLPTSAGLSTGNDAGGGQWLVPHRRLKDLKVTLLNGISSDFRLEILLLREEVELSDPVTFVLKVGLAL